LIKQFHKQVQADLSALGVGDIHGTKPNLEDRQRLIKEIRELSVIVERDEAMKSQQPSAEFVRTALENKKKLNSLLDQLLAIEKRRKQLDVEEPGEVRMVAAWTNTDMDLIIPLFEQHKKGEKIMVESYAQTVAIKLNTLIQEAKEDEKLWNEVELIHEQQIVLAGNYTEVDTLSDNDPKVVTIWQQ
jgi:hypothetical protein